MNLPGPPRLHVWVGLLGALAGALVGGYAYTGDRIFDIVYLPVALAGLALLIAGSALAGYGQANRPRLGGRQTDDEEDEPSFTQRLRASAAGLLGLAADEEDPAQNGSQADGEQPEQASSEQGDEQTDEPTDGQDDEAEASQGGQDEEESQDEGGAGSEDEQVEEASR